MPALVLRRAGAGMLSSSQKGQKEGTKFSTKLGGERSIKGKEPESQRQNNPNYCSHSNSHSPSSRCQAYAYQAATECAHALAREAVSVSSPGLPFHFGLTLLRLHVL